MTIRLPEDFVRGSVWITLYLEGNEEQITPDQVARLDEAARIVGLQVGAYPKGIVSYFEDVEVSFVSTSWPQFRKLCLRVLGEDFTLPPGIRVGYSRGGRLVLSGYGDVFFRDLDGRDPEDLDEKYFLQILSPIPTPRGPRLLSDASVGLRLSSALEQLRR